MSILNPFFLGFLALALIPLILYIIFRLRRNEVLWGASYILRLTLSQKKKQNIWKQICILTLRTIALLLLVLAFARPFLPQKSAGAGDFPHGPERLHRIILIDNSQSMLAASGPRTRLDVARGVTAGLLTSLRTGDTCDIITLAPVKAGEPITIQNVPCPVSADRALALTSKIVISPQPIDLTGAVRAAIASFRDVSAPQRQMVTLTDLCRIDYPDIANYDMLGEQLSSLHVREATLNLGSRDTPNMAIESLSSGSELFLAEQPTNVYVSVTNYGDTKSPDTTVKLLIDGKPDSEQTLALPPGGHKTLVFPVTLSSMTADAAPTPGGWTLPGRAAAAAADAGTKVQVATRHRIEARLSADAFPLDDAIETFVTSKGNINVLVVSPFDTNAKEFEGEAEFLGRALKTVEDSPFHISPTMERASELLAQDIDRQDAQRPDVVILCGVDNLPPVTIEAIEKLVRRGGGLIIAGGPGAAAQKLNETFKSLLPMELDEPARANVDVERYVSVQTADIDMPLLREFGDSKAGDLDAARIYNYFRLKPMAAASSGDSQEPGAATKTLLSLSNGAPLLVERAFGKGTVLLWTSGLGAAWSSLPVHHAFLPMLVRLVNYTAGLAEFPRNVAPGTPLIYKLPNAQTDLFMTTPDSKLIPCPIVNSGSQAFVRFDQTDAPGIYELQDKAANVLASFAVARSYHESDLRQLEPAEASRLEQALNTKIAADVPGLRGAMWRAGDGMEYTSWFLLAAMLLVALDALLTWSWFR